MTESQIYDLFLYSTEECKTFPYLGRYVAAVKARGIDLSRQEARDRFMLAGLFLTYRACNHMGVDMTTVGEDGFPETSIHARRLRVFGELTDLRITSTADYWALIRFRPWSLMMGGVSGFLKRFVFSA